MLLVLHIDYHLLFGRGWIKGKKHVTIPLVLS